MGQRLHGSYRIRTYSSTSFGNKAYRSRCTGLGVVGEGLFVRGYRTRPEGLVAMLYGTVDGVC